MISHCSCIAFFFFFNDTATTEIYPLSLHDALPISGGQELERLGELRAELNRPPQAGGGVGILARDRKSTRLNSSHLVISYAVFCLKKKKKIVLGSVVQQPLDVLLRSDTPRSTLH